jgi:hypothetical protein
MSAVEPIDDPSADPAGTVRRSGSDVVVKTRNDEGDPWCVLTGQGGYWRFNEDVTGWEIIGAVPGTPAAASLTTGPRTFAKDGPEPPADVKHLREEHTRGYLTYLNRAEDGSGWVWSSTVNSRGNHGAPWNVSAPDSVTETLIEVIE